MTETHITYNEFSNKTDEDLKEMITRIDLAVDRIENDEGSYFENDETGEISMHHNAERWIIDAAIRKSRIEQEIERRKIMRQQSHDKIEF